MKKTISLLTAILLLVCVLAGCNSHKEAIATDGSTSMEKGIGGLGERFMELDSGVAFTYTPPAPAAVSKLCRKVAATLVWHPGI